MKFKKKRRVSDKKAVAVLNRGCDGKSRYDTEEAALEHSDQIYEQYGEDMKPYRCKRCGFWHLTSDR